MILNVSSILESYEKKHSLERTGFSASNAVDYRMEQAHFTLASESMVIVDE